MSSHGIAFRSFKKSASFNPETGEEIKIVETIEETISKKDLLDEILKKENLLETTSHPHSDTINTNSDSTISESNQEINVESIGKSIIDKTNKVENFENFENHENHENHKNHNNHENHEELKQKDATILQNTSHFQKKKSVHFDLNQQKINQSHDEEIDISTPMENDSELYSKTSSHKINSSHTSNEDLIDTNIIEDQMINDKYEDLPLYERLKKNSLEDQDNDEDFGDDDNVRKFLPSTLSSDDLNFYDAVKKATDTRERDRQLRLRLEEKMKKHVLSLEEKKRKGEEIADLFKSSKRKKEDFDLEDVVLEIEPENNLTNEIEHDNSDKTINSSEEILNLFSGYSSD